MPSLVFPFHDPNNIEVKFLREILPILKSNFQIAFVSITPKTVATNPEAVDFLKKDNFFFLNKNIDNSTIGDHFLTGCKNAVENSSPDQVLHLCSSDRLAFVLLSEYRENFLKDIEETSVKNVPLLFLRSPKAWETHPKTYQAAESMVTEVGKVLFQKTLDFSWCHLALTAQQLASTLPSLIAHDLVIYAQLIMNLNNIKTKEVDWLSWEDPFIFGKDPKKYKIEREKDPKELEKRMSYVLPEINYLFETFRKKS